MSDCFDHYDDAMSRYVEGEDERGLNLNRRRAKLIKKSVVVTTTTKFTMEATSEKQLAEQLSRIGTMQAVKQHGRMLLYACGTAHLWCESTHVDISVVPNAPRQNLERSNNMLDAIVRQDGGGAC